MNISKLLVDDYSKLVDTQTIAQLITVFSRYIAPSWGLPYPSKMKRMTPQHRDKVLFLLSDVSNEKLENMAAILEESLSKDDSNKTRLYKSVFYRFYKWLTNQELVPQTKEVLANKQGIKLNIKDLIEAYSKQALRNNAKGILMSAIARFIAPNWGQPYPPTLKRMTPESTARLLDFLSSVDVAKARDMLIILEEGIRQRNPRDVSSYKSTVVDFYNWCAQHKLFEPRPNPFAQPEMIIVQLKPTKSAEAKKNAKPKVRVEPFALMTKVAGKRLPAGVKKGNQPLAYPEDRINEALQKELDEFKAYRKSTGMREATIAHDYRTIMMFLGWLVRFKEVSLDDLRLTMMIHYYPLTYQRRPTDTYETAIKEQAEIDYLIHERSAENIGLIQEYFKFKAGLGNSQSSKKMEIKSFIAVAKFLYNNDLLTSDKFTDFSDIPVIKKLQKISRDIPKEPPKKPYAEKMIGWDNFLEAVEYFRQLSVGTHTRSVSRKTVHPISEKSKYVYLQKFLILAFNLVIPPQRSRSYYQLEIGKSFMFGKFEDNRIIPHDQLKDEREAAWYMYLRKKYNDGSADGYWSLALPNVEFKDGSRFYDYIDLWLTKGREFSMKCNHDCFFHTREHYEPFDHTSWGNYLSNIFMSLYGIPVAQNSLRHMYITQLAKMKLSDEVKFAAAIYQNHSKEIADSVYNEQSDRDIMALLIDAQNLLMQKILNQRKIQ